MIDLSSITSTDIISIIVSFVLGLLIGLLIRKVIQVGLIILAIIIILIAIGAISPSTVEHALITLGQEASKAQGEASTYIKLLPYNTITFIIGFVIGLVKG
ncbi:hypothetical protein [Acidianus manzaensis]|uniref:hypothetical protein n=1 Tax=Acidianus manzaensis TaxID=282676 RepID=UPI0016501F2D|nr:hypothetical protein [Acidianus manzaensis]